MLHYFTFPLATHRGSRGSTASPTLVIYLFLIQLPWATKTAFGNLLSDCRLSPGCFDGCHSVTVGPTGTGQALSPASLWHLPLFLPSPPALSLCSFPSRFFSSSSRAAGRAGGSSPGRHGPRCTGDILLPPGLAAALKSLRSPRSDLLSSSPLSRLLHTSPKVSLIGSYQITPSVVSALWGLW